MPDSRTGKLIEIQNLSTFISTSNVDFNDEKYQELQGLSEIDDVADFEIIPRLASEKKLRKAKNVQWFKTGRITTSEWPYTCRFGKRA